MKLHPVLASLLVCGITLLAATPVQAVIKLELTLSKIYDTSRIVMVGKVTALQAESRVIDVGSLEAAKGTAPGPQLRIVLAAPADLFPQISVEQPVAIFVGRAPGAGAAVIHVADTWLLAKGLPGTEGRTWQIVKVHEDAKPAFPGRTVTLVRLIEDLKAGRHTILDKFEQKLFVGGIRQRAKLSVQQPTWLMAADVNGDQQPDLVVGTAQGTKLFVARGRDYIDATDAWGRWGDAGAYHAAGDVNGDGKVDLLLDDTLWINEGQKFTKAKLQLDLPSKTRPLAAALADATGDGKPDAVLLSADGELRVFENSGSVDRPWPQRLSRTLWKSSPAPVMAAFGAWGETNKLHVLVVSEIGILRYLVAADSGAPADLERLSGVTIAKNSRYRAGLKSVQAVAFDADGNGRPDLLAVCETGGLLLVNRGFGVFLLDPDAAGPFLAKDNSRPPFQLSSATPWTAARLRSPGGDDLLILTADGTLYEAAGGTQANQ